MGACSSSAALDPVDVTGDGTAPVYWSPERDAEKRAAKLRETQQKQQAEIQRATGHLKKHAAGRRSTISKSKEEEKQQADEQSTNQAKSTVQPARLSRTSRPASVSFPSPLPTAVLSEEELSEYPLPKSARRHARAVSASVSSMASPTRSPEVSVSVGMRSEGEGMGSPRQQATPMAARRASTVPESVKEGEERPAEEEKQSDEASAPQPHNTTPASLITPVRVVALTSSVQRDEKAGAVERGNMSSASGAFGVQLRRVSTTVKAVDMTAVPTVSAATTA